jgi:hypothetical protein
MSDTGKKQAVREYMLVAYVWEKKSYQEMYQIVINSLPMRARVAALYQLSNDLNISLLFWVQKKSKQNEMRAQPPPLSFV